MLTYLITTHNAERTISNALESLVIQSRPAAEVILVDDGSTDSTVELASRFLNRLPLRLIRSGRVGRASALNIGVASTDNELIAILDADDIASPCRTALQIAAMNSDPNLGVCGGHFYELTRTNDRCTAGLRSLPESDQEIRSALAYRGAFCHSTVTYRRSALVRAGGFRVGLRSRIDQDLWVRIGHCGYHFANIPHPLAVHVKDATTYFAKQNTLLNRLTSMFARNVQAVRLLNLPRGWYAVAVARCLVSLVPVSLMSRNPKGRRHADLLELSEVFSTSIITSAINELMERPSAGHAARLN